MPRKTVLVVCLAALVLLPALATPPRIGVFIPGIREGSPTYDDLARGAERFASEIPGATLKVFEAGFDQAAWQEKLTSFVATGSFDIVITSNPSLPDLIDKLLPLFPKQKFICLDGMKAGNPNLHTVLYNQTEQGYLTGYLAGLISMSSLPGANRAKKAGMIIGQHYPVMDKLIVPGFEQGLKAVDAGFTLDLRVLGNWFDATKAAELARSMFESGVDVVLPICGSASQGVVKAAQDGGKYILFFDSDEYSRAPASILGCSALRQEELAYGKLKEAYAGKLKYGTAEVVGVKEGYIEFLDRNPAYVNGVPAAAKARLGALIAMLRNGSLSFPIPAL